MNELELFVALNEQAETVKAEGRKVAVILEGRDSAGKSGTIKNFTRYLPNYTFKVQPSFKPSRSVMRKWLSTWAKKIQEDPKKVDKMLKNEVPLQCFGNIEDVANTIVFLASKCAKFVNGANWVVDGGQTRS